jgi:PleD family two-component response regulator
LVSNTPYQQSEPEQREHQQKEKLSPFTKRILIVDDHPDIILTFKKGLEAENEYSGGKIFFQVYAYHDPLLALSEFKLNLYDLLLVDVNMPKVNGFEFSDLTEYCCFRQKEQILRLAQIQSQIKT